RPAEVDGEQRQQGEGRDETAHERSSGERASGGRRFVRPRRVRRIWVRTPRAGRGARPAREAGVKRCGPTGARLLKPGRLPGRPDRVVAGQPRPSSFNAREESLLEIRLSPCHSGHSPVSVGRDYDVLPEVALGVATKDRAPRGGCDRPEELT